MNNKFFLLLILIVYLCFNKNNENFPKKFQKNVPEK